MRFKKNQMALVIDGRDIYSLTRVLSRPKRGGWYETTFRDSLIYRRNSQLSVITNLAVFLYMGAPHA